MSHRPHTKSRIKVCNKSVFHLQDKKAEEGVLSSGLIKSAKRTGQLSLSNRGLGAGECGPDAVLGFKAKRICVELVHINRLDWLGRYCEQYGGTPSTALH